MERTGRDDEFTAFVAARTRALLGTSYLLAGDRGRGEDLLQTALLKTYLAWPRLREFQAAEAYVRRTMVTTSISWSRRRWRGELPTETVPEQLTPDGTSQVDRRAQVWPHLRALPPRQRAVLVLKFYEDLPEAQIAGLMGCSVGTVKSQTHRALATLRTRMGLAEPTTDADADLTRGGGR